MVLTGACLLALIVWLAVLLRPAQPHRTRERLEPRPGGSPDLGDVTVLIPARNEAAVIAATLRGLAAQGPNLRVVVIDDESTDATAAICARFASPLRLELLEGRPLPAGWGGKLWALEQGLGRIDTRYALLLDADIELDPGVVAALLEQARSSGADLVSVMARLRCEGIWERLLVPPFVFFFKLLYPFARVNAMARPTAAAAGGCLLVTVEALRGVGGFARIRAELIDDCSLAALVKRRGGRIWLGLSTAVRSLREYPTLESFWRMVSRTAFTQLRYSTLLLALVTTSLIVIFVAPVAALAVAPAPLARLLGGAALIAMAAAYYPVVAFYRRPPWWTATLPVAAVLFLAMTLSSALNYWRGLRAQWKNRDYAV